MLLEHSNLSPSPKTFHILSIGNANMDLLMKLPCIPLEDEKIQATEIEERPGGSASNYAVAASRIGLQTGFIGCVGQDEHGKNLALALTKENVDIQYLQNDSSRTGLALVFSAPNGVHSIVSYRGANAKFDIRKTPDEYITSSWILHCSGAPLSVISSILALRKTCGAIISVDPGLGTIATFKQTLRQILSQIQLFFVNEPEFMELTSLKVTLNNVKKLAGKSGGIVSVQRGADGVIISNSKETYEIPAYSVAVKDTTGAGDTYTAAFTSALIRGYSLKLAGEYGCIAAALKCTIHGPRTGMPNHSDILKVFRHHKDLKALGKKRSWFFRQYAQNTRELMEL